MKKYDMSQKRVMGGSGYKLSIAIIAVLAAVLLVFMLIILPAIEEEARLEQKISSIEYPEGEIGLDVNLDQLFVKVNYDGGYSTFVALSDMLYEGVDNTKEGEQFLLVNYGGFEQILPIVVKSVNCKLIYQTSTGGSIDGELIQEVPSGQSGNRVIARPEVGYIFVDWSDGNPNPERKDYNVRESATITANFKKAEYTVIFRYPDGTVAKEQIVTYNERPTQVPTPTDREMQVYGYVFDRWNLPFDRVTQDMTIDPIFVKRATDVSVDITKNNRGDVLGTLDVPSEGYYPKNKVATINATPNQARSFDSWQIKSYDGTWVTISVADIRNQSNFRLVDIGRAGNTITFEAGQTGDSNRYFLMFTPNMETDLIELKANFVYDVSTITFINSMSGKAGNIESIINLPNGEEIGSNIAEPSGSGLGYSFIGWFREDNSVVDEFGNAIAVQPYDTFTQPSTLIARWQKVYFEVRFLTGDGDLPPRTVHVLYQDTLASAVEEPVYINPVPVPGIPTQTPKQAKHIFIGWYLVGSGNILTDVVIDEDYKVFENINVRPKFIPISHDLQLNLNGAGAAQRRVITDNTGFQTAQAGINKIEETKQYIYRFTADNGFQIKSVTVNGNQTNYTGNVVWADVEVFFPNRDMNITVEFIPRTYYVTIQNGLMNDAGNIRYMEKVEDVMVERSSNSSVVNFYMEHNTSRNIYVSALQTHFIHSITVGQQVLTNIPLSSSEYTIILNSNTITQNTTIVIEYRPFAYLVNVASSSFVGANEVYYNSNTDSYIYKAKSANYAFGDNPLFMFEAVDGYFIKGLRINGKNIDLYSPDLGFDIINILVNNSQQQDCNDNTAIKDERITGFVFRINNINSNYTVESIYAPLYYNVNIEKQGRGEANFSYLQTDYNESIQVHAETDGGYYVKSYILNGVAYDFQDMLELQTIDINNITEDINMVIIFSIATYSITFDGSTGGGRNSSVRKDNDEFMQLNVSYAAEHNSSNKFTVKANTGFYISRIIINNVELVIPNNVAEYDLQIDNVTGQKHVVINCARIRYTVRTLVNNSLFGSATSQITVNHGDSAVIDIIYADGYTLDSISEGTLSANNTKLTISAVTQNKLISINFKPIIYNIAKSALTNGEIIVKSTALYNEEIFVQVASFDGYVIDFITINGNEIALTETYNNYVFSYTVTQNVVINAAFVQMSYINPLSIEINQNGGTINGLTGSYTATVYDSINSGVLIKAPAYHYISSISGESVMGTVYSYALLLDGSLSSIYVEYLPEEYNITLNNPDNGSAEVSVSNLPNEGFVLSNTALYGQYIKVMFYPDEGYTLDKLKINGELITDYIGIDPFYVYTGLSGAQNIEVSYKLIQFTITTEVSGGFGVISSDNSNFEYGSSVLFKIIPAIGYRISDIIINGQAISGIEKENVISSKLYQIAAGSARSKADIVIRVSFERIYQRVNVILDGEGRIDQAFYNEIGYGEYYYIDITADQNNFIQAVEIDGIRIEIDNTNLHNYTFNDITQKYTAGRYRLHVTKDLNVKIYFARNVYNITILPSVNGLTTTNLIDATTGSSALNITSIEHGNFIQISMKANTGYNIAKLYINSQEIPNFKHDNVNPNNNRLINYIYRGVNNQGVNNNILIRVDYEINYYKFQYELVNESPNFKDFDTSYSSFGMLSVMGNYPVNGTVVSGIPHGENFRLSINPVREKGYIISGVTITYIDPNSVEQSLIIINPQVGGAGATVLRTGAIVFFSELMGQYAQAMVNDVQKIQVRFTKETFIYEQEVVSAPHTGTISTRIYHPNDSSRALTVGSVEPTSLILINGQYEFGLGYTISIIPAAGHTRTAFYFLSGNAVLDRNNSVRANTYNSIIQSDLYAKVRYEVNVYDITFSYVVYSFDGSTVITNPGSKYGTISLIAGGDMYSPNAGTIRVENCAFGTALSFIVTPEYFAEGYYIHSFIVGTQNLSNQISNKNNEYIFNRTMGDNNLVATVVFMINTYSISYIHQGADGRNSVVSETPGRIAWGWGAVLRLTTDAGYNLVSLEVYQNGEWQDRKGDIIYNQMHNLQLRDILQLTEIKEDIVVKAVYARKEYDIKFIVNDLNKGSIRVDIIGDFYPNYQNIPQSYSQLTREIEDYIYDPILGTYYWGTVTKSWDVVTMQAKHHDELLFYLFPEDGYRVRELIENGNPQFDKVKVALYKYVNSERVPVTDNYGNPIVYYINTVMWDMNDADNRRFVLPTGVRLTSDIEVEIDFMLKEYSVNLSKTPGSLSGVPNSLLLVEKLVNETYVDIADASINYRLNHFDNILITISAVYGLSLEGLFINDVSIPFTTYICDNNTYSYYFELEINDALLNKKNFLQIEARLRRNIYDINVEIYDNKSGQTTYGTQAPTLKVETVSIISHGNILSINPVLSEGYSVVTVIINGQDYSMQINDMNSQFSFNVSGDLVNSLDVHDNDNNTIKIYFITAINLHISSIRAYVFEQGVDTFSDIAGDTTITYNPADTMVIVNGVIKYEYFTNVTVTAVARSTPEKIYRFAYYQEQVNGVWQVARDGERGVQLSGSDNSILQYTINVNPSNNVTVGDRFFRAVYYRVLTVTVTVMPDYKYVSGFHTTGNMRYLQYLTVQAMVGNNIIEDKNPNNAPIYAMAAQLGTIPYVESYTYYIDSGSFLKLTATDHNNNNLSSLGFYDKISSTNYQQINNISTTGIRIIDDRDIHLVARNQTMMSFNISTIKNESGVFGGSLTWNVINRDNTVQPATVYRGSMNSAKALDTVRITVRATQNYRFTGLYIKNVDIAATKATGELKFIGEGQVGEWTLIDSSNDLIQISTDHQGNTVFTIFVTSNMVMKFEFYRTFKLTYDLDYQGIGPGPGDLIKDSSSSSMPIHSQIVNNQIVYEIYDYSSQIRLIAPPTNEDYQFVGWLVNGENIYTDLDIRFPEEAYYSYWFRLYQNFPNLGITDGLNLRKSDTDIYEINIVAIYQPIFKVAVINESYFYHQQDDHWNTWRPSINLTVSMYEYFTNAQVMSGESEGNSYSLAMSRSIKNNIMSSQPYNVMDIHNSLIPARAINSEYDNKSPVWSEVRKLVNANGSIDWSQRSVYTTTSYYKMLYKAIANPDLNYNEWTDNILYLETILAEGMALVEWQYYDFSTGTFIEIPYVSNPIMSGNTIIGHTNNAKRTAYTINLSGCSFIDHTKPLIIRPKYQKKVTLNLGKKAYYDFFGDFTTIYNNAQTPQIYNSPETDAQATFNYYTKCLIIPRAASGYRFIDWYKSANSNEVDDSLIITNVPGETTVAWQVHLKFDYGMQEQNYRFIQGRYIKQWEIRVSSRNLATGDWVKNDAPKLVLSRILDLQNNSDITDLSRYSVIDQGDWSIHLILDAGLGVDVNLNMAHVPGALQGYNPEFDKLYDCTDLRTDKGEFATYSGSEITFLRVSAFNSRTIQLRYETFGELIFENLMFHAGIRLTDIMSGYIKDRFKDVMTFPSGPIIIRDGDDNVIDGRASFNMIPIRDINYMGSTLSYTYDYVPYGFNTAEDNYIPIRRSVLNDSNLDLAHFDSRRADVTKRVTINYQNYKLFGIGSNGSVPGTESNPYLIGVNVNNSNQLSTVAQARTQFRNIEVFFDNNNFSCANVVFSLQQDIHLNSDINSNEPTAEQVRNAYNWVPICYKNDRGFDGTLLGNGKALRSLYVNGLGKFVPTNNNAADGDITQTKYDYLQYGYGIFSSIQNGTIKNVKLGTATIMLDYIKNSQNNEINGPQSNIGLLAARISGDNTLLENIEIITTDAGGYVPGYNIYIKGRASQVGVIAGHIGCQVTMTSPNNKVINSTFIDIKIRTVIYINARSMIGAFAGLVDNAKVRNLTITSGTITVETVEGNFLGGAIGLARSSDIQNSYLTSTYKVGSSHNAVAGGFIGKMENGDITCLLKNCYITGSSNSYVAGSSSSNDGANPDSGIDNCNVGGLVGYNMLGTIDNCYIRNTIHLRGYFAGGIVGSNSGTVKNCNLTASHNFSVRVQTPGLSSGGYGIIAGVNRVVDISGLIYSGLVIDCSVVNSAVDQDMDLTNTKLYVYPTMVGENKALNFKPLFEERTAVNESIPGTGYTSVGGIAGLNQGRVFNSYVRSTKILAMRNSRPEYHFHIGGVVGFNQVGSITNGRGISSCYSDGNSLLISNIIWSHNLTDQEAASNVYVGIGGVVGGTMNVSGNNVSDYSIRYCYGINNKFYSYNVNFGADFQDGDKSGLWGMWGDRYQNPFNNNTTLHMNVGLVVGGGKREMSRAYYSWGGTNSSWVSTESYYGDKEINGGSFRNGVRSNSYLISSHSTPHLPTVYSGYWNTKEDREFFDRLIKINVEIYTSSAVSGGRMGDNMPALYGGFISRTNSSNKTLDSRVLKTNEDGNISYSLIRPDFNASGDYIGSQSWTSIMAALVPGQTKYEHQG